MQECDIVEADAEILEVLQCYDGEVPSPTAAAIAAGRAKVLTLDDDELTELASAA